MSRSTSLRDNSYLIDNDRFRILVQIEFFRCSNTPTKYINSSALMTISFFIISKNLQNFGAAACSTLNSLWQVTSLFSFLIELGDFPWLVYLLRAAMVYFKDANAYGKDYLVILDDKEQPIEKGTRLRVHKPLIGSFAPTWPRLTNPSQHKVWTREIDVPKASKAWVLESTHHKATKEFDTLPTLGRRIIKGEVKWDDSVDFAGEFCYFKGYWEWCEDVLGRCGSDLRHAGVYESIYASLFTYDRNTDIMKAFCEAWCPSTNTLLTSNGELSISLWDLHSLSGLPACGTLYDEVIPCSEELVGSNRVGNLYLPLSCKHLFHAYHVLKKQNSLVLITYWIKFWSKKKAKYPQPPPRKEKKCKTRSKLTHNPSGDFETFKTWSDIETVPFTTLGIKEKLWNETYTSAFIVCWLCTFVFPDGNVDSVRPNTFKMASMIATCNKVALTIPVLASIFRGLNSISKSLKPSRIMLAFPVHFVYSWLAIYFKTHFSLDRKTINPKMVEYSGEGGAKFYDPTDSRKRIHKGNQISWNCAIFADSNAWYIDHTNPRESDRFFFIAIRSSYLARRQGDSFIIEPYSPHRFSRQFGYYQDVPGILNHDTREATLADGFKHWRTCLLHKTMSEACFQSLSSNAKDLTLADYKKWWNRVHGNFLEDNIEVLIQPQPHKPVSHSREGKSKKTNSPNAETIKAQDTGHHSKDQDEIKDARPRTVEVLEDKEVAGGKDNHSSGKRKSIHNSEDSVGSSTEVNFKRKKKHTPSENHAETSHHSGGSFSTKVLKDVYGSDNLEYLHDNTNELFEPQHSGEHLKVQSLPHHGAVSVFNGKALVDKHRKACLGACWGEIRDKIMKTAPEFMSSIQEDVLVGFSEIKLISVGLDISHLESSLDKLFTCAVAYDKARSSSFESEGQVVEHIEKLKGCLHEATIKDTESVSHINSLKQNLADMEKQREILSLSLKEYQESRETIQDEIKRLETQLAKLQGSLKSGASDHVKNSKSLLEFARRAMEDQDPFV